MTVQSYEELYQIWQKFICRGLDVPEANSAVAASWQRSRQLGVDPFAGNPSVDERALDGLIKENRLLLEVVTPFIELIDNFVQKTGFILTLTDNNGIVIKVSGDSEAVERAKCNLLIEGARRAEKDAGTNAISLALTENRPIQTVGPQHYKQCHHDWTCSAAPIHDTQDRIIGVLNLSGHRSLIHKHTLGMVSSMVQAIERELRIREKNFKLRLVNEQLKAVVDSVTEGVIAIDEYGRVIQANEKFRQLFHLEKYDPFGKRLDEIFHSPGSLMEILQTGKEYFDREETISRTGITVSGLVTGRTILNDKSKIIGVVGIIREKKEVFRLVNKLTGAKAVFSFDQIVHEDPEMANLISMAKAVAETDTRVLLEAESGTGKELFAQAIHNDSARHGGPFIAVNCSAIPRELIESELFGYAEGAFTGAKKGGKPGKFELADGGTLFLDEVNSMPLEMQVKLLRVLQQNEVTRLGSEQPIPLNVRIISASNCPLDELVQEGHFRLDLFYRMGVVVLKIPPLRERIRDIPILFEHLLQKISRSVGKKLTYNQDEILPFLCAYDWPGNVRELENYIERAVVLARTGSLSTEYFPEKLRSRVDQGTGNVNYLAAKEREVISKVLEMCNGNISKAAKNLGISRNTLYAKIKAYGIMTG